MTNNTPLKTRFWLKALLAKEITSGDYSFNQVFPSIQKVAQKYQVSYLTASRAMKMLQSEGYLRCENGVGHFVAYVSASTAVVHKKVNIITSRKFYGLRKQDFTHAIELFQSKGWNVELVLCPGEDISSAASAINSPEAYSVICGLNVPWECFHASLASVAKRVLILGMLSKNLDVTSIISNEYETIRLAMGHFAQKGRKDIGILMLYQDQELEALRVGAWRSESLASGHDYEWTVRHCFSFSAGVAGEDCRSKFERFEAWLKSISEDTDGLIVPVHHLETVALCMKLGMRIPDDLSILLIAVPSPALENVEKYLPNGELPFIEALDHNYAGHFRCALEILEGRFRSGKKAEGCWHFCPPGEIRQCTRSTK